MRLFATSMNENVFLSQPFSSPVLLFFDKTENLGVFLGVVMMAMVALFLIVVVKIGLAGKVDPSKFGWGFLPNFPLTTGDADETANIIVSLVGTTSIGFNLFLGGAMAQVSNSNLFSLCYLACLNSLVCLQDKTMTMNNDGGEFQASIVAVRLIL